MTSVVKGGIGAMLIAMLAWTTEGAAQNVPGSCPAPRTIYTFTDSSSLQALPGAPPPFCRFANLSGGQQVDLFLGAFSAASPIVQANIDVLTSLLPLQVGKTAHLARVGSGDRSRQTTVQIEKQETIEVPVGRLACFVLLWTEPSGQGKWERRWWYCPSLEYAVKYTAQFEVVGAGGQPLSSQPTSWELMGVRVP
ncbi:MAG: hypothetical protein E6G95_06000 [Alphaproteobacteria bacterium]|nr:MAG: hypothetical protein E6G95_06000 [Alphaproteobacteria bacterium]